MKNKLYRVNLCHFHEQGRNPNQYQEFLCITTVDKIREILDLYDKLWNLTWASESTIIAELEGLDPDALLEDIETGEKFWYVNIYDKDYKVQGYELESIK